MMYYNYNNNFNREENGMPNREEPRPVRYVGNTYTTPPGDGGRKKKKGKGRVAALLVAVAVIAGAAGGGAGWLAAGGRIDTATIAQQEQAESTAEGMVQMVSSEAENETKPSTAAASGETNSVATVAGKASASVVEITTEYMTTQPFVGEAVSEGAGSGVIFSEDGYIITNNHVIDGAAQITVTLSDGTEYAAELIGTDAKTDLAVIKIEASGLLAAEFADSSALTVGELAVAIGNPLGELGGTVTSGIVSAAERDITIEGEAMTLIQTSAAVNPGNSGGGLFNGEGQLIGIVNSKLSGENIEGLAFAIPSNTVREIIAEIIENGYVTGRPQLGVEVIEVADQNTAMMYRLNNTGVYIAITDKSLNVQSGDRILSIDGVSVASMQDVSALIEEYAVGDTVTMVVERGGQQVEASITLTEENNLQSNRQGASGNINTTLI
ncbi:trypsin-like peptidase domain-containing protein [Christensenellaceae bacterium OttesenSCG-928-K19]|nr:trypsin-like peptidase domain-containing protein [Christensenellaceae bacterium OttesenSCG-928-K19]